jgi:hypothetical protein
MENVVIDRAQFQKMNFIMNAIDSGWSVTKNIDAYVFKKKHEEIHRHEYGFRQVFFRQKIINCVIFPDFFLLV